MYDHLGTFRGIEPAAIGRSYPLRKGLTGLNRISASFSKADVQKVRLETELDVRLWPKAAVDNEAEDF